MDLIKIGEIVNTHGIKGEVRLLSDFKYKNDVFKKGMPVYIGRFKDKQIINGYRVHKCFDMLTFEDINNINDVIIYKTDDVYVDRSDLKIDGILDSDLIGLDVYSENKFIGKIESIMKNKANDILFISNDIKKHLIPNVSEFVSNIALDNKKVNINVIEGLLDEN